MASPKSKRRKRSGSDDADSDPQTSPWSSVLSPLASKPDKKLRRVNPTAAPPSILRNDRANLKSTDDAAMQTLISTPDTESNERHTPRSTGHSRPALADTRSSLELVGFASDVEGPAPRLSASPSRKRKLKLESSPLELSSGFASDVEPPIVSFKRVKRSLKAPPSLLEPVVALEVKKSPTKVIKVVKWQSLHLDPHKETILWTQQSEKISRRQTDHSADTFKETEEHVGSNENATIDLGDGVSDVKPPTSPRNIKTKQLVHSPSPPRSSERKLVRLKKAPPTKVIEFVRPAPPIDSPRNYDKATGPKSVHQSRKLASSPAPCSEAAPLGLHSRDEGLSKPWSRLSSIEPQTVFGLQMDSKESGNESELDQKLASSPTNRPKASPALASPTTRKLGKADESLGLVMSGHRPKPGDADYEMFFRIDDNDTSRREFLTPDRLRQCMARISTEGVRAAKEHIRYIRRNGGDSSWNIISAERVARQIKAQVLRTARTTPLPTSTYRTSMFRDRAHVAEMERQWQAKIEKHKVDLQKLEEQNDTLQRELAVHNRHAIELQQRHDYDVARAEPPNPRHQRLLKRFKPQGTKENSDVGMVLPWPKIKRQPKVKDTVLEEPARDVPRGMLHQFLKKWSNPSGNEE